jgi:hypothetical protein
LCNFIAVTLIGLLLLNDISPKFGSFNEEDTDDVVYVTVGTVAL